MMEDQLNKYVEYLQSLKYSVELENEKIKIFTNIEGVDVILWCSLGDYFPYEIPEVFIDKECRKKLPRPVLRATVSAVSLNAASPDCLQGLANPCSAVWKVRSPRSYMESLP